MAVIDSYLPTSEQFQIFWPLPVRAHVGVDINFRPVWYEVNNEQLTWSLLGQPAWMSIHPATGLVSGAPSAPGTHGGITLRATRQSGLTVSASFTCTVDNSKFIFVSPAGSDSSGTGSIGSPYATVRKAADDLAASSVGKTIYLRGGTYYEGYTANSGGIDLEGELLGNGTRTAADYQELRGYPGESVLWDFNSGAQRGGFSAGAPYSKVSNLELKGLRRDGYTVCVWAGSQNVVIQDCICRDLDGVDNMAGIQVKPQNWTTGGYVIVARNVCYNIYKQAYAITDATQNNTAGILYYSDVGNNTNRIWILNNKGHSTGHPVKCKHSGSVVTIIQANDFCHGSMSGAQVGGAGTIFRKNVISNCYSYGMIPNSDGGPEGPMLIEGNTFVAGTVKSPWYWHINVQANSHGVSGSHFYNNLLVDTANTSGTLFRIWEYEASWSGYKIECDYNLYYNNPDAGGWRVPEGTIAFTAWQAKTMLGGYTPDAHSQKSNPMLAAPATGNFNITSSSPAANMSETGSYVGALAPDKIYGTFGAATTTLVDMQITGAYTPPPEPEPAPDTLGVFGAIYFWRTFR